MKAVDTNVKRKITELVAEVGIDLGKKNVAEVCWESVVHTENDWESVRTNANAGV